MQKKVVVIAGPTASGKTALSIALARALNGEIVSADSMQIYRRMDIGTAKATAEEQAAVPHHMIDLVEPEENYSVSRYVEDASEVCENLLSGGKIPFITGGTGLYIDSLLSGRNFGARDEDPALRDALNRKYELLGGEEMLCELSTFDPDRAAILHAADRKRIVRAFEVYLVSGKTISQHDLETRAIPPRYEAFFIIPGFRNRENLYTRINRRVDFMFQQGLVDEVQRLLQEGISAECTSMQAIGYKEIVSSLSGIYDLETARDIIQQSSRRYAKRQLTWFSRQTEALRLYADEDPDFLNTALCRTKEFLDE